MQVRALVEVLARALVEVPARAPCGTLKFRMMHLLLEMVIVLVNPVRVLLNLVIDNDMESFFYILGG